MHIMTLSISGKYAESIREIINKQFNCSFSSDICVRFISEAFDKKNIKKIQENNSQIMTCFFSKKNISTSTEIFNGSSFFSEDRLTFIFAFPKRRENNFSLEKLITYCDLVILYEILKKYIDDNYSSKQKSNIIVRALKELFIEELIKLIFCNFSETEQSNAFEIFFTKWEKYTTDIICKLAEMYWEQKKDISQIFENKLFLEHKKAPVKTIAFFSIRAGNGGTERVTASLCNMFASYKINNINQFKVILITEIPPQEEEYPLSSSIIRRTIPEGNSKNYFQRAKELNQIIDDYNVDLYIDNIWSSTNSFWDSLIIKSNKRHPAFISYCHSLFIFPSMPNNIKTAENLWYSLRFADAIITLNQVDKNYWSSINTRTYMVKNPCQFSERTIERNSCKNKDILWLARIDVGKNIEDIFPIMEEVVKEIPDAICRIVGKGKPSVIEKLLKERKIRKLENNIFFEGFFPDVEAFYKSARIFLSTSEIESYSLTIYESAAFGIPLVAYELPYLEYFNTFTGWTTVPQRDTHSAAQAIIKLLKDDKYWNKKSIETYESFQKSEKTPLLKTWLKIISDLQEEKTSADKTPLYYIIDQLLHFHKKELERIKKSESYRVGLLVTSILRKLKRLVTKILHR